MPVDNPENEQDLTTTGTARTFGKLPRTRLNVHTKELAFPLTLIGVALMVRIGLGFYFGESASEMIVKIVIGSLLTATLGVAACLIVAAVIGTSFGTFTQAIIKLVAVALFPSAIGTLTYYVLLPTGVFAPIVAALATIVLTLGLLQTLFELEIFDLFVLVLALWGVESAVGWGLQFVARFLQTFLDTNV